MRELFRSYGYLALATYFLIYLCTLGAVYELVAFGVLKGPDPRPFIKGFWLKRRLLCVQREREGLLGLGAGRAGAGRTVGHPPPHHHHHLHPPPFLTLT